MNIIIAVILLVIILIFRSNFTPQARGVKSLSTKGLKAILHDEQKQYIDVRTPKEFSRHHIKGFRNIPLQDLPGKLSTLTPEKETVVVCQSGMRSLRAAKLLKKAGFKQIYNVKNGMNAWY